MLFLLVNRRKYAHIHYQLPAVFVVAYFAAAGIVLYLKNKRRVYRITVQLLLVAFLVTSSLVTEMHLSTERVDAGTLMGYFPPQLQRFSSVSPEIFSAGDLGDRRSDIAALWGQGAHRGCGEYGTADTVLRIALRQGNSTLAAVGLTVARTPR